MSNMTVAVEAPLNKSKNLRNMTREQDYHCIWQSQNNKQTGEFYFRRGNRTSNGGNKKDFPQNSQEEAWSTLP
jgi:hypothetical protein